MARLLIFGLTCIIFNLACGQSTSQKRHTNDDTLHRELLSIDTSRIAVFNLKTDWWLSKKLSSTKSFSLTNADIKNIDAVLKKCTNENNIDTAYFHYKRQYVPFTDKDGQKKVWINCFCSEQDDNEFTYWKKSIVMVEDGGSCFFNVIINLGNNSFSNLEVNGIG